MGRSGPVEYGGDALPRGWVDGGGKRRKCEALFCVAYFELSPWVIPALLHLT